jgi:hypothetical protein
VIGTKSELISLDQQYPDTMKKTLSSYPGQFETSPDPLFVAIPRVEIIAEMAQRGDEPALNDVCLAVAVVAEAMNAAWLAARDA